MAEQWDYQSELTNRMRHRLEQYHPAVNVYEVMAALAEVVRDYDARRIDVRKLAGVAELAALFLLGRSTVTQWAARRDRNGFPEPVTVLAMGPIYDLDEVVDWYARYVPDKGGRPGRMPSGVSPSTKDQGA